MLRNKWLRKMCLVSGQKSVFSRVFLCRVLRGLQPRGRQDCGHLQSRVGKSPHPRPCGGGTVQLCMDARPRASTPTDRGLVGAQFPATRASTVAASFVSRVCEQTERHGPCDPARVASRHLCMFPWLEASCSVQPTPRGGGGAFYSHWGPC